MESEEFEQIPWASLVAEQEDGIDRRIYLAVGVVGLLVIAVFGMRLFAGGSQPPPIEAAGSEQSTASIADVAIDRIPPTSMIIAEADLRTEEPVSLQASDVLVGVTAEWFVTDWFTRDGSPETIRSIRMAVSPTLELGAMPHESEGEPVTFVEWAKTVASAPTAEGVEVTVVFRAIRETEDGFVRDPVRRVILVLQHEEDTVVVSALPLEV